MFLLLFSFMLQAMTTILLAGASGKLGRLVAQQLKGRAYSVRALLRQPQKVPGLLADQILKADLTVPTSLQDCCQGVEVVLSCAGASMNLANFTDRRSFMQVDYRGNCNLLQEAKNSGVRKFVYVSLAGADRLMHTKYVRAHEQFVLALKDSGLEYSVIRPTGFFYFYGEILKLAQRGVGFTIAKGEAKTNPIHEAELAGICAEAIGSADSEIAVGGEEVFSRREIAELAFEVLGRPPVIRQISPRLFKAMISPVHVLNPRVYALLEFGLAVSQGDCVAPRVGKLRLGDYFRELLPPTHN